MSLTNIPASERDSLLDAIWRHAMYGCAIVDKDGNFIHANPAFCALTEYTEYELQRRTFQDITIPEDVQADVAMSARVANGEAESYDMVKHYLTKSKHIIRITLRVAAIRQESGEFEFFFSQIAPAQTIAPTATHMQIKASTLALNWWRQNWALIAGWAAAIGVGIAALFGRGTQ